MAEMGKTAIELLVALLEGRKPLGFQRELATELIVRESTGHPGKRR
jgi:DNA-binding LacI/PurR family transcriptional regulator